MRRRRNKRERSFPWRRLVGGVLLGSWGVNRRYEHQGRLVAHRIRVGGALRAPRRQSLLRSCLAAHSFPRRPPAYVLSAVGTPVTPIRLTPNVWTRGGRAPLRNLEVHIGSEGARYGAGEAPSCGGSPR